MSRSAFLSYFHCSRRLPVLLAVAVFAAAMSVGEAGAARLSLGDQRSCAISAAGPLKCWGNAYVGNGQNSSYLSIVQVFGLESGAQQVALGTRLSCAIAAGGGVKCWGRAPVGDGTTAVRNVPTDVVGVGSGALAVAAGYNHGCAVTATHGVRCWGVNDNGQLGDNTTTQRNSSVDVIGVANALAVAAGQSHSCALISGGGVKCWGDNSVGQLGDGSLFDRQTAVDVTGLGGAATAIAAGGGETCAIVAGALKCWGANTSGQVGDGSTTNRSSPTAVLGLTTGVAQIAVGGAHACARTAGGAAYCWGANDEGQIGDGTTVDRLSPAAVSGLADDVVEIGAGINHSCARLADDTIGCWGLGGAGGLGTGLDGSYNEVVPVRIAGLPTQVTALAAGGAFGTSSRYGHSCARTQDGAAYCWGSNDQYQTGLGGSGAAPPAAVAIATAQSGVRAVLAGHQFSCLLTTSGGVKCWGDNAAGQLGNNTTNDASVPQDVAGASAGVAMASTGLFHGCAVSTSGGVRCWGLNDHGQIGDGTMVNRRTAVDVATLTSGAAKVAAGYWHSCALTTTGGVKCWGDNTYGQLGDGTFVARSAPTPVVGLASGVAAITTSESHTCARLTSGAVKCWGLDDYGQLGDGNVVNQPQPVDVVGLGAGSTAEVIAGGRHTCARLASGALQCWGNNDFGQLGDSTTGDRTVPTQVTGFTSGVTVVALGGTHTCAVKGGAVYCFGRNTSGELGDSTYANRTVPTPAAIWPTSGDTIFRNGFEG